MGALNFAVSILLIESNVLIHRHTLSVVSSTRGLKNKTNNLFHFVI